MKPYVIVLFNADRSINCVQFIDALSLNDATNTARNSMAFHNAADFQIQTKGIVFNNMGV